MTTADLRADGFVTWMAFNRRGKVNLLSKVPSEFGVYVVRSMTSMRRRVGESDIVQIGSACNQNGLRSRIAQYFSPGPTQITNKRILALVREAEHYQIGWFVATSKSRAVGLEQELLERFVSDHGERPPQNLKG